VTFALIRLLSDVDGNLVSREKVLTDRSIASVTKLKKAGILFAVTSGPPHRGMPMHMENPDLETSNTASTVASWSTGPAGDRAARGPRGPGGTDPRALGHPSVERLGLPSCRVVRPRLQCSPRCPGGPDGHVRADGRRELQRSGERCGQGDWSERRSRRRGSGLVSCFFR
jgi:hypothetical protein